MLLLITDTSGKDGFVGMVRISEAQGTEKLEVIEEVGLAGGTFSAQLVPQISALLAKHRLRKTDIGAFIVVSGPGSFTGLRVGLAAIKALAEILHPPIVSVSLLEVLALHSQMISVVLEEAGNQTVFAYAVALDAGRREAFVGKYETVPGSSDNSFKVVGESLMGIEDLAASLESEAVRWIATPDQTIFDALTKVVSESKRRFIRRNLRRPRSLEVAELGWRKLQGGSTVSPEALEANYLRRSDAEIFPKPSSAS